LNTVLAQVLTAPMLSKSEKILMNLNSKQKPLCQLATAELFPTIQGNSKHMTKMRLGLCLRSVVLSLCNHAKSYFLAWWSLTAQAKGPFQDSKELKRKGRSAPGEVVHTKDSVH